MNVNNEKQLEEAEQSPTNYQLPIDYSNRLFFIAERICFNTTQSGTAKKTSYSRPLISIPYHKTWL